MSYRLTPPLVPMWPDEDLAGVRLGDDTTGGFLCCAWTFNGLEYATWRIRISGYSAAFPDVVLYDDANAIRQPVRTYGLGRQAREVLAAVIPFLLADAESYRRTMGAAPPADGWIFNAATAQWAYLNDAELQQLADVLGQP